jgi:CheY-like chemotaxis protein
MTDLSSRPVFVVEDSDEDFTTIMEGALQAGVKNPMLRFTSGDQFLQKITSADYRRNLPALVLLDLNLPGTDGRQTLAELRRHMSLRQVPVLVLTTSRNERDVLFCYQAGANVYHVKPVSYLEHIDLICTTLNYWLNWVTLAEAGSNL